MRPRQPLRTFYQKFCPSGTSSHGLDSAQKLITFREEQYPCFINIHLFLSHSAHRRTTQDTDQKDNALQLSCQGSKLVKSTTKSMGIINNLWSSGVGPPTSSFPFCISSVETATCPNLYRRRPVLWLLIHLFDFNSERSVQSSCCQRLSSGRREVSRNIRRSVLPEAKRIRYGLRVHLL